MQEYRILHTLEGFYVPQRLFHCGYITILNRRRNPYDVNFSTREECAIFLFGMLFLTENAPRLHELIYEYCVEESDVLA